MIIRITKLRLQTIIGVNDWERIPKQNVVITVTMDVPDESAADSDSIDDTVDYSDLKDRIVEAVNNSSYNLIEALARRVLDLTMEDERVAEATVQVGKPGALHMADTVSVTMTRSRET